MEEIKYVLQIIFWLFRKVKILCIIHSFIYTSSL